MKAAILAALAITLMSTSAQAWCRKDYNCQYGDACHRQYQQCLDAEKQAKAAEEQRLSCTRELNNLVGQVRACLLANDLKSWSCNQLRLH